MKKHLARYFLIGVSLALIGAMAVPVLAQEGEAPAGPGEGGVIIEGTFGGDPGTFNPFYCNDTTCGDDILGFMFPALVGVDPAAATFQKAAPGALALDWTISEDGTVYTFTLRDDYFWTDGAPVTAYDVEFGWDVTANPEANADFAGATEYIADVVALDDYTVQITFTSAGCNIIRYSGYFPVMPKHVFEGVPITETDLQNHPFSTNPSVSAGVFKFGEFRPAEQVSLLADQNYPDTVYGHVLPAGRIVKQVPDQTVLVEQFLAGELNALRGVPPHRFEDVRAAEQRGELQTYDFPGNAWDYMGFNLADPTNPQNGLDEEGNPIDQGHHPLFGDLRVRKAIAMAVDVDAIIQGAVFGNGTRMTSAFFPGTWSTNPDMQPLPYDPDGAKALLEEAGWKDEDGDGVLEAHGALYAPDGTPFQFTLYTNEGNTRREAIGTIIQDQLKQIGVQVDFQTIEFNTLLEVMYSQEYDAYILGWRSGYPYEPVSSIEQILGPSTDVIGNCSDCGSYNNPEVYALLEQANTVPGCNPEDQIPFLYEAQQILADDLPYLWMYSINGMYAASADIVNFNPYPAQMYWNIDAWAVIAAD